MLSPRKEVIVVGGGPVGMLLAAELGAYGVHTLVLEAESATSDHPKAGTLHARTVQSLARRGYLDAFLDPSAESATALPFHFAGMPGLTITVPAAEPTPILKVPQADLERSFEARARSLGVEVLRGRRVVEVSQGPDGVEVVTEGAGGRMGFSAEFLIGADGARSLVRERTGFTSDVRPATVSAMMGLVRFADPLSVPGGWRRTERGWTAINLVPDGHSLIRTLNLAGPHTDRHAPVTLAELRAEAAHVIGHDVPMTDSLFLTRFSDFTRVARRFRDGRVILAGDAAHVHFPIGGQGLSTGLLDAFNLGWKLAHAVRGTAGKGLLDTYDEERRPAARRVIDNTRAQLALMSQEPAREPLAALFGDMLARGGGDQYLGGLVSAQDTVYPARQEEPSRWEGCFLTNIPITEGRERNDLIGLLRDGRPLLIISDEGARYADEAYGWRHVLRTVTASAEAALPWEAVLVRPDGYVAWAADGTGFTETLRDWFGEPREEARRSGGSAL